MGLFVRKFVPNTRIRYSSAGVLVRELVRDLSLANIGVLVFDDFFFSHCLEILLTPRTPRGSGRGSRMVLMESAIGAGDVTFGCLVDEGASAVPAVHKVEPCLLHLVLQFSLLS